MMLCPLAMLSAARIGKPRFNRRAIARPIRSAPLSGMSSRVTTPAMALVDELHALLVGATGTEEEGVYAHRVEVGDVEHPVSTLESALVDVAV